MCVLSIYEKSFSQSTAHTGLHLFRLVCSLSKSRLRSQISRCLSWCRLAPRYNSSLSVFISSRISCRLSSTHTMRQRAGDRRASTRFKITRGPRHLLHRHRSIAARLFFTLDRSYRAERVRVEFWFWLYNLHFTRQTLYKWQPKVNDTWHFKFNETIGKLNNF